MSVIHIKCAEEAVENYVGNDRNKLLQLKAEAEGGDFYSHSAFRLAVIALVLPFISICLDIPVENTEVIMIRFWLKVCLTALCIVPLLLYLCRFNDVLKWRNYIVVAINEVEKNI